MNIAALLHQHAVYWCPSSIDGYGKTTFLPPEDVVVRWQDVQEEFVDNDGRLQRARSVVYCNKPLKEGGFLYLGTLFSIPVAYRGTPDKLALSQMIRKLQTSQSVSATYQLYKAYTT